jgi:hypothetical protein
LANLSIIILFQAQLSNLGKRDVDGKIVLTGIFDQVLQPAINNSIQTLAGMLAQMTASIAVDGLPALNNIINSFGY